MFVFDLFKVGTLFQNPRFRYKMCELTMELRLEPHSGIGSYHLVLSRRQLLWFMFKGSHWDWIVDINDSWFG